MALTKITNSAIADDIGLGGNPTTSTQTAGDSTTRIATTAFVSTAVANLVDSAPDTLNTLAELATSIGNSTTLSSTLTSSIATKLPLAGGTLTGNLNLGDNVRARFGLDSDLQIYHDGSNSHIINTTGDLTIDNQGDDVLLKAADDFIVFVQGTDIAIQAVGDGKVGLRYNNFEKLVTTNTGIDVTGNIGVTGTVDGIDIAARDAVLTSTTTTAGAALPKAGGTVTGLVQSNSTIQTTANIKVGGYLLFDANDDFTGSDYYTIQDDASTDVLRIGRNFNTTDCLELNSTGDLHLKGGNLTVSGNIALSGTVDGVDIAARDAVLTSTTTTAGAALPKAGGTMTGTLTSNSLIKTTNAVEIASAQPRLLLDRGDGSYSWNIYNGGGTDFPLSSFNIANNANTAIITALDGGNVGIGTTAPARKLQVKGTGNTA